jgi:hypothetical protein
MAPKPQQIASRRCGCCDCLEDLPPHQYGHRPSQTRCVGPWEVRYRADGWQRAKRFASRPEAQQFIETQRLEGEPGAA